jgi:hypothetical protein
MKPCLEESKFRLNDQWRSAADARSHIEANQAVHEGRDTARLRLHLA